MSTPVGASIKITVRPHGSEKLLLFEPAIGQPIEIGNRGGGAEIIRDAKFGVRYKLENFKNMVGTQLNISDQQTTRNAMDSLLSAGRIILHKLAGGDVDKLQCLHELFRRMLPNWRLPDADPIVIEVSAVQNAFLPLTLLFEILPIFDFGPSETISSVDDLLRYSRRFLGFSSILYRRGGTEVAQDRMLLAPSGRLPVKIFSDRSLGAVQDEIDYLYRNGDRFEAHGPWPDDALARSITAELAKHLFDPRWTFKHQRRKYPDQIQHFACHCYIDDEDPDAHRIKLSDKYGTVLYARIDDIRDGMMLAVAENDEVAAYERPCILFNACGSAIVGRDGLSSFVSLFVNNRNRAFIGTEASIPDKYAARFATMVYAELVNGKSLGEAVYLAKQRMLRLYNNPLGILYSYYGNPDLVVNWLDRQEGEAA